MKIDAKLLQYNIYSGLLSYFGIHKLQQLNKTVGKAPPNIIYGHPNFHLSLIVSMPSQTDNIINVGMTQAVVVCNEIIIAYEEIIPTPTDGKDNTSCHSIHDTKFIGSSFGLAAMQFCWCF